jgi:hypothetical protein
VLREDAVSGKVGPWDFTLAEVEPDAPKQGKSGAVMKAFELRFSDAAHPQIRSAYLQARKPRSLRASSIAFEGQHLRTANIPIPPAFQPEEQIWLTVEGWNGEVHQTALEIPRLSPSLARFLAKAEPAQKSDEGWDSSLTCWSEGAEILCQGATFGSGETRYMDGTAIEVSNDHGETLLSTRLNRQGQIRFPHPEGKFYVLLEEGPGKTVEVNWQDVEATSAARKEAGG